MRGQRCRPAGRPPPGPRPSRAAASVTVSPPGASATRCSRRRPRSRVCAVSWATPRGYGRARASGAGTSTGRPVRGGASTQRSGRLPFQGDAAPVRHRDPIGAGLRPARRPARSGSTCVGSPCSPAPHIGHLRSGVNYDVLRRWLLHTGYEVTFIRNITDIDDKVLVKAVEQGVPFWSIAYANELILGRRLPRARTCCRRPTSRGPPGTSPEMHELISDADRRRATPTRPTTAPATSTSTCRSFADVRRAVRPAAGRHAAAPTTAASGPSATRATSRCGRAPRPTSRPTRTWPSPWGRGRPGWHIECSAMCWRYLGAEFDIHGGGLDLTFPHHENEVAQSRAAGLPFARYWVHHALLNLGEAKMSKSLGNVIDLADGRGAWASGRSSCATTWPRRTTGRAIDYSDEALREAAVGVPADRGLRRSGRPSWSAPGRPSDAAGRRSSRRWTTTSTPRRALAVVHETVREGNTALAAGDDDGGARRRSPPCGRCSACSASTRSTEPWTDGEPRRRPQAGRRRAGRARAGAAGAGPRPQGLGGRRRGPRPAQAGREFRSRTLRPVHAGRSEAALMPGNSQRRGRRVTSKKGATVGSGGKNRAGLKGRGRTLPADERPWHKGYSGTEELPAAHRLEAGQGAPGGGRRGPRAQGRHAGHQGHHLGSRRRPAARAAPSGRGAAAAARQRGPAGRAGPPVQRRPRTRPELLRRPQPGGRGAARARAGHRALRRAGHRHRRPGHRDRPHRRRPGHPDPGDQPRRARPDDRRRAAPGHRPAGAAVRVRAVRRPARRGAASSPRRCWWRSTG